MQTNRKCLKPLPVPEAERVCKMSANSSENPPTLKICNLEMANDTAPDKADPLEKILCKTETHSFCYRYNKV